MSGILFEAGLESFELAFEPDESVFFKVLEEEGNPVVQGINSFTEFGFVDFGDFPDCSFPVTIFPKKTADFIQLNPEMRRFHTGQQVLGKKGIPEFGFQEDNLPFDLFPLDVVDGNQFK